MLKLKKIDNGYMCKPDYEFKDKDGNTHLIEQDYEYNRNAEYNVYCDSLGLRTHTLREMKEAIIALNII